MALVDILALGSHKDAVGFYCCLRLFTRQTLETYAHINKKSNTKIIITLKIMRIYLSLASSYIYIYNTLRQIVTLSLYILYRTTKQFIIAIVRF